MRKLTVFYLEHCPYCRNARKAISELTAENPAYRQIEIQWVEESEQPALAGQYDYYYVPTVFDGEKKLYEAHPGESFADCKKAMKAALDAVL